MGMQPHTFNYQQNRVFLKNVDMVMGVARSLAAQQTINIEDINTLAEILDYKPAVKNHPLIREIAAYLDATHATSLFSPQGRKSLHDKLRALCGVGSDGKPIGSITALFSDPEPPITFNGKSFCFTGKFDKTRLECAVAVQSLGGTVRDHITQDTHYLVIGSKITDTWRHHTFGGKITQAKDWNDTGVANIEFVSEDHWEACLTGAGWGPSTPPPKPKPSAPHTHQQHAKPGPSQQNHQGGGSGAPGYGSPHSGQGFARASSVNSAGNPAFGNWYAENWKLVLLLLIACSIFGWFMA